MTLKDGYRFGGFSGTPPSEPNLSTPPPPRTRILAAGHVAGAGAAPPMIWPFCFCSLLVSSEVSEVYVDDNSPHDSPI